MNTLLDIAYCGRHSSNYHSVFLIAIQIWDVTIFNIATFCTTTAYKPYHMSRICVLLSEFGIRNAIFNNVFHQDLNNICLCILKSHMKPPTALVWRWSLWFRKQLSENILLNVGRSGMPLQQKYISHLPFIIPMMYACFIKANHRHAQTPKDTDLHVTTLMTPLPQRQQGRYWLETTNEYYHDRINVWWILKAATGDLRRSTSLAGTTSVPGMSLIILPGGGSIMCTTWAYFTNMV